MDTLSIASKYFIYAARHTFILTYFLDAPLELYTDRIDLVFYLIRN